MNKTTIRIVVLGYLKYRIDWRRIISWKSNLFTISPPQNRELLPNAEGAGWDYSDDQLSKILSSDNESDITVGIINATLQDNFYLRRLSNNKVVLSLTETAEILKQNNLEIENFIIRNLYEIFAVYQAFQYRIPESAYSIAHDETRCCLFDMCPDKNDIVHSNELVKLCEQCRTRLKELGVPAETIGRIEIEVSRIKKGLFFRVRDFVVDHPILSICLSLIVAIIVNLAANYMYDVFKSKTMAHQTAPNSGNNDVGK